MSSDLHLDDFTSKATPGKSIPRYYGNALVVAARGNDDIVALSGDLTPATEVDLFRDTFPDRFFNVGIAEANMVGIAAGMARKGDLPFVHTFSVFLSRRALDQVAMQIAYPRTNVKLVGFLPGLTTLLGVSHQAIDDLALMRALPNLTIVEPCGAAQIASAVAAVAEQTGPVYLRMHRPAATLDERVPALDLTIGEGQLVREGDTAVIFACGHMVEEALQAAAQLATDGVQTTVANIHTLKPLDKEFIAHHAQRTGCVVTAENHSIIGGLGSAVAETLMEAGVSAAFHRIGVNDTFAEGGSTAYLFDKYGLSAGHIRTAVLKVLQTRAGRGRHS